MMRTRVADQQGVALASALIFLLVITLLGLVAARTSTTELQLARNVQTRVSAMQTAQSVVDAVVSDNGNLPLGLDANELLCYGSGNSECTGNLTLPASVTAAFSQGIAAEVRRLPPATAPAPGALLTSLSHFGVASFAVRGQFDRGQAGLGAADIEQGVIKLVPKPARTN